MLPSTVRMFHRFCALISQCTLMENEGEGREGSAANEANV